MQSGCITQTHQQVPVFQERKFIVSRGINRFKSRYGVEVMIKESIIKCSQTGKTHTMPVRPLGTHSSSSGGPTAASNKVEG